MKETEYETGYRAWQRDTRHTNAVNLERATIGDNNGETREVNEPITITIVITPTLARNAKRAQNDTCVAVQHERKTMVVANSRIIIFSF